MRRLPAQGMLPQLLVLIVCCVLLLPSCGRRAKIATPRPPRPGDTQEGIASWYGDPYHGRRAANGEIYDMNELTAAHREWPFETLVRVFHLSNGREVAVRITDRGPFVDGRIIDLSRAAAERIGMIGPGTARVRLTVLSLAERNYAVQAGAFREQANAARLREQLERDFGSATIEPQPGNSQLLRVLVGPPTTREAATRLARRVAARGYPAIVVDAASPPPAYKPPTEPPPR